MSNVWIVLLVLSFLLAVALVIFYEYYVYQPGTQLRAPNAEQRGGGWAHVLASIVMLLILGLWIGFAVTYYQDRKRVVPVVCQPNCVTTTTEACQLPVLEPEPVLPVLEPEPVLPVLEPEPVLVTEETVVDRTDFY